MESIESNVGKWQWWYHRIKHITAMGSKRTYRLAAEWLASCARILDWGCGPGGARPYFKDTPYFGVDGTKNPFVDQIVDLATFVASPPYEGVMVRHILEHNHEWQKVLRNALRSATQRVALVTFVPFESRERLLRTTTYNIPVIALRRQDVLDVIIATGAKVISSTVVKVKSSEFGAEEVFCIEVR